LFVSKRGLGTIWRPLYFEFPKDPETYSDDIADSQFMIGAGVLVTPIVEQGKVSRSIYLPKGNWLHFHSGTIYKAGTQMIESV
jgi:alpha-glucosidase